MSHAYLEFVKALLPEGTSVRCDRDAPTTAAEFEQTVFIWDGDDFVSTGIDFDAEIAPHIDTIKRDAALNFIRVERNARLFATDVWVLPDRSPTQAQLDYRQALRDITDNCPDATLDENNLVTGVTWPTKPE